MWLGKWGGTPGTHVADLYTIRFIGCRVVVGLGDAAGVGVTWHCHQWEKFVAHESWLERHERSVEISWIDYRAAKW